MKKNCGTCKHKLVPTFSGPCEGCEGMITNYSKWEDKNKMSQFKAMKFWIGEGNEKFFRQLQTVLFSLGYKWPDGSRKFNDVPATCVYANVFNQGVLEWDNISYEAFLNEEEEEIDIDWMRIPKKETIELNGKKYLKEDLEEALKHLKPVG